MRRTILGLLAAMLAGGCSHAASEQRPETSSTQAMKSEPAPTVKPEPTLTVNPKDSGRQKVHGGEALALEGADVKVVKVVYVNSPCPKGAECIHSGIIKVVQFKVARGGQEKLVSVSEGNDQVVEGVQLRVFVVTEGPQAEVEASLPVVMSK